MQLDTVGVSEEGRTVLGWCPTGLLEGGIAAWTEKEPW